MHRLSLSNSPITISNTITRKGIILICARAFCKQSNITIPMSIQRVSGGGNKSKLEAQAKD